MANCIQSLLLNNKLNFKLFKIISINNFNYNISKLFIHNSKIINNLNYQININKTTKQILPFINENVNNSNVIHSNFYKQNNYNKLIDNNLLIKNTSSLLIDEKRVEQINQLIKDKQLKREKKQEKEDQDKPSPEQIDEITEILIGDFENFFVKQMNYLIYDSYLIFENHIRGTKTIYLGEYVKQLAMVKLLGHLKYAYVEFKILKITKHYSEGTIKMRWQINGLSGLKVFKNFWKYKVWNLKETAHKDNQSWYDGFSIFYLKGDGKIHKHVLLKMQPDEDKEIQIENNSPLSAAKIAS